jgi:predicted AAA+ superfamily ATPase
VALRRDHLDSASESFVADIAAWLQRDVDRDAAAHSVPLLVDSLFQRSTSPLNRTSAANELGYASRQTFDSRLHRLANSFAAFWCPQVDDHGNPVTGAQAKLYLSDPLLCTLGFRRRAGLDQPDYSRLSEGALAIAVARTIDDLQPGRWAAQDTVGYLRTDSGREIDFAPVAVPTAAGPRRTTAIESKWVSAKWRSEAMVIENKLHSGIVATRTIVDTSNPTWALPASLVALLLG